MLSAVALNSGAVRSQDRQIAVDGAPRNVQVALVIGNSVYAHVGQLANPRNDAKAMAKLFTDAGFATVDARTDLGVTEFRRALADFEVLSRDADVAVIYYSGHGIEFGGQNYLVPLDAAIRREVDVQDETVPLDRVLNAVAGAKKLKLVILDACRADPFQATTQKKSVNRGFVRVEPSEANELVAYAAKAGTVADDGDAGGDSPFTAALLKRLTAPGLDVEFALRKVRDDVLAATHREQEPFYYGSMGGDELPLVAKPQTGARPDAPAAKAEPAPLAPTAAPNLQPPVVAKLETGGQQEAPLARPEVAPLAPRPVEAPTVGSPPLRGPIKLGVAGPISGPNASFGAQMT